MTTQSAQTATIAIQGMNCQHCVQSVRNALTNAPGVRAVEVNLERGQAKVTYDPAATSMAKLMQAVNGSGFTATGFTKG